MVDSATNTTPKPTPRGLHMAREGPGEKREEDEHSIHDLANLHLDTRHDSAVCSSSSTPRSHRDASISTINTASDVSAILDKKEDGEVHTAEVRLGTRQLIQQKSLSELVGYPYSLAYLPFTSASGIMAVRSSSDSMTKKPMRAQNQRVFLNTHLCQGWKDLLWKAKLNGRPNGYNYIWKTAGKEDKGRQQCYLYIQ